MSSIALITNKSTKKSQFTSNILITTFDNKESFFTLLFMYSLIQFFRHIAAYSSHKGVESPRVANVPCGGELLGFCVVFELGRGLGAALLPLIGCGFVEPKESLPNLLRGRNSPAGRPDGPLK